MGQRYPGTFLGLDIGGSKCAAVLGRWQNGRMEISGKKRCETEHGLSAENMLETIFRLAEELDLSDLSAVGISCGGPLDAARGVILGPPNLPGWDRVPVVQIAQARFGCRAYLENDANACAIAEWQLGAGRGCENMVFLTFGTGLGAGLILNGRLYAGTNGNAGEAGHIRLAEFGPSGYGKAGSFEGFCSGGGLSQLGWTMAQEQLQRGTCPAWYTPGMLPEAVTAKALAQAARAGDITARRVYELCGMQLGRGLAVLVDLLNPEKIVIGSIFARAHDLIWPAAEQFLRQEALAAALSCCEIVPAALGEAIGDYAALCVALTGGGKGC